MFLSVIIPVLNEAAVIRQALERAGGCGADEVLVVDGGSRDDTVSIVRRTGCRLVHSAPGRAFQMNAGAAQARGDVFLFLHADTRLPATARSAVASALADEGTVGGRFDVRLDQHRRVFRLLAFAINWRSRLTKIATGDQAIFVRRRVFEAMRGFKEIPLMEDVDFSRRLRRRGKVACLRECVITSARRWQRHGPWKTIALMWTLRLLYFLGVSPARLKALYQDAR